MDGTTLFVNLFFSMIGFGIFLYGKKQKRFIPLIGGLTMSTIPYFVDSALLLAIFSIILIGLVYFIRE